MFEKLTDIFQAAAVKYLTAVDVKRGNNKKRGSNQHEIGGLPKAGIGKEIGFPENGDKWYLPATLVYIFDDDSEPVVCEDTVSWYDTRYDDPNRSPEYRLYYKSNDVTELMYEGDFFLIGLTKERTLLMVFCSPDGTAEAQLRSVFGAVSVDAGKTLRRVPVDQNEIVLPIRTMLAQLGVEIQAARSDDAAKLQMLLDNFGNTFPKTREFSAFAVHLCGSAVDAIEDPDSTLLNWMDEEENLFRILERHIVSQRLSKGFGESGNDVDEFIRFSLSVQNRRKSRVGHAFENHIEEILRRNSTQFERGVKTEGKQKPDFLFPGREAYVDPTFDTSKLRILGAKTSCKERWRQVLAEAKRIERKHLITLEPAITVEQTDQMHDLGLQLVVPAAIQSTYTRAQKEWLISFREFIRELQSV